MAIQFRAFLVPSLVSLYVLGISGLALTHSLRNAGAQAMAAAPARTPQEAMNKFADCIDGAVTPINLGRNGWKNQERSFTPDAAGHLANLSVSAAKSEDGADYFMQMRFLSGAKPEGQTLFHFSVKRTVNPQEEAAASPDFAVVRSWVNASQQACLRDEDTIGCIRGQIAQSPVPMTAPSPLQFTATLPKTHVSYMMFATANGWEVNRIFSLNYTEALVPPTEKLLKKLGKPLHVSGTVAKEALHFAACGRENFWPLLPGALVAQAKAAPQTPAL